MRSEQMSKRSTAVRQRRAPNAMPKVRDRFLESASDTISEVIRKQLRADIVSLRRKPGDMISEKAIAEDYGVSRTPVREAVLRLADEKLIEIAAKSGTYVARIPLSALPETLVVRRALEGVTVRAATRFATRSQITGLRAIIQRQQEAAASGDYEAFHLADEDFHASIAVAGGHAGIWGLILQVKVNVDRYRVLTLPQEGRRDRIIAEHTAVVDAMEAGDADSAVGHMESHLNRLREDIREFRDMQPDYFIHDIELDDESMA